MYDHMFKFEDSREVNQQSKASNFQSKKSQFGFIPFTERNLIDLDVSTTDFDSIFVDPDELMAKLEVLRKKKTKEDVKFLRLEKEKEKITMNTLLERESLQRRMVASKENNKRLEYRSATLQSYIFGDVGSIQSKI